MSYPNNYRDFHAGNWKDGEFPISNKCLMHVKRATGENDLFVIDELHRDDFIDWLLEECAGEEALKDIAYQSINNIQREFVGVTEAPDSKEYLRLFCGVEVREIYIGHLLPREEVKK